MSTISLPHLPSIPVHCVRPGTLCYAPPGSWVGLFSEGKSCCAHNGPVKQPTRLVCRHMALKSAKEGYWHVFSSKLGMEEEEAAIIELRKLFVSCLGLSGLQRGLRSAKFSGWPCPMWRLPSSVAQEPLLKVTLQHFNSFLHLFFCVAEAFLLACIFMRVCLTHWALMAGTPFGPCFQKSITAAGPYPGRLDVSVSCPGRLPLQFSGPSSSPLLPPHCSFSLGLA